MITNSLRSPPENVPVLQRLANMFREQITRELTDQIQQLLVDCPRISFLDTDAGRLSRIFNLSEQTVRWHRAFVLKALKKSLRIKQGDLSPRSGNQQISISFDAAVISDHLVTAVSPQISKAAAMTQIRWLADLMRLSTSPTAVFHLHWNLNEKDAVSVQLIGSTPKTKDWLAEWIADEADSLAAAVNRSFAVETMTQTIRIHNETPH